MSQGHIDEFTSVVLEAVAEHYSIEEVFGEEGMTEAINEMSMSDVFEILNDSDPSILKMLITNHFGIVDLFNHKDVANFVTFSNVTIEDLFSRSTLMEYMHNNYDPQDVFPAEDLCKWAAIRNTENLESLCIDVACTRSENATLRNDVIIMQKTIDELKHNIDRLTAIVLSRLPQADGK